MTSNFCFNSILCKTNGRGMSALTVVAERDRQCPECHGLSKTQVKAEFLFLRFFENFFNFFQKKLWLMSNIQIACFFSMSIYCFLDGFVNSGLINMLNCKLNSFFWLSTWLKLSAFSGFRVAVASLPCPE